jgi:hypothetical protein
VTLPMAPIGAVSVSPVTRQAKDVAAWMDCITLLGGVAAASAHSSK